jgi:hypothetical protein
MPIARRAVIDRFRAVLMVLLGIILALVPPALWVAWTESMLFLVVAIGVVSAVVLVVLADTDPEGIEDAEAARRVAERRILADRSVAEIHRVFPLTYHHSRVEGTRFRQAMEKVRQLLT